MRLSSLARGWVCCIQFLLALATQSFSGQIPAVLMTIFYCLRFENPRTRTARSPYFYPPGTGRPDYIPRHWISFSSPPTTRRATVGLSILILTVLGLVI
jgi:hypothetical protein